MTNKSKCPKTSHDSGDQISSKMSTEERLLPTNHAHQENNDVLESSHGFKVPTGLIKVMLIVAANLVAVTIGWVAIPGLIRHQISNKLVISPDINPELYTAWLSPPIPIYFNVYLFNVTNPEQVRLGKLPKLVEVGPYIFLENRTKVDVSHDEKSDTVTYMEHISYHFQPDLSGDARLSDVVTVVNVPLVAAAIKISHTLPWPLNEIAQTVLISFKETLFVQKTVDEVLFKGWTVDFLQKLENVAGVSLISGNKFGFLVGQNDSAQGPYTISRGLDDNRSLGAVLKFKNESTLNFWGNRDTTCNQLSGSDGTIFPPFVTKDTTLRLFNAEICRSLYIKYDKDVNFLKIPAYRFTAPASTIADPQKSPENLCFCPDVDEFPERCLSQGVVDMGPCKDGAPVAMSFPHFLDADEKYQNMSGLTPNRDKHETFMIIEPLTGVVLHATKKLQVSLVMEPVKGLSSMRRLPKMPFPLMWADEWAAVDVKTAERIGTILFQVWLFDAGSKCILLGISLVFSLVIIYKWRFHSNPNQCQAQECLTST